MAIETQRFQGFEGDHIVVERGAGYDYAIRALAYFVGQRHLVMGKIEQAGFHDFVSGVEAGLSAAVDTYAPADKISHPSEMLPEVIAAVNAGESVGAPNGS